MRATAQPEKRLPASLETKGAKQSTATLQSVLEKLDGDTLAALTHALAEHIHQRDLDDMLCKQEVRGSNPLGSTKRMVELRSRSWPCLSR